MGICYVGKKNYHGASIGVFSIKKIVSIYFIKFKKWIIDISNKN